MAGTLFGLGLMPQFDAAGVIARGALLYLYSANTSTPVTSYSDSALTTSQVWPLEADSGGRLPAFWLADGDYRARLTTSAGVEIFDEQSITAIGASSGASSGSTSQDTSTLHQSGDFLWQPVHHTVTRSGWVRANGKTIGSSASAATERANSDTQTLFEFLWNTFSDAFCAVSTGRGGSATADFNANKTIVLLDMRDSTPIGLSGMGNTSSGLISDTGTTAVGATTTSITIAQANLPSVNFVIPSNTVITAAAGAGDFTRSGTGDIYFTGAGGQFTKAAVNVPSGGSGTAISKSIIPNGRVGTWYIKL